MRLQTLLVRLPVLLAASLIMGSCEEKLPTYETPDYELRASLAVEDELEFPDGGGGIGPFGVDILNITGGQGSTGQFWLKPPYEIRAAITISLATKPSRNKLVEKKVSFEADDDRLGPGEFVRIYLDFPPQDSQGHPWNWENLTETEFFLEFGGTVTVKALEQIPPVDIEMHPPTRRVKLIYVTP